MGTVEFAVVGLAGSGVGTALGVPMVWPGHRRSVEVRFMGGWLLALSVLMATVSARVLGILPALPAVNHVINLAGLSGCPLVYLYVREQTGPVTAAPIRFWDVWWLWIPAAIYCVCLAVRAAAGANTSVAFIWVLPAALGYTVLCLWRVRNRREIRPSSLVPPRWIAAFLLCLNVAQVVRMVFGHIAPVPALVPLVLTAGMLALVAVVVRRSVEADPEKPHAELGRYGKSALDAAAAKALLARIEAALSLDRLFADPNLTLGRLAAAANLTPHQVSEVLNRYALLSFHEFLNRQRVEDVKAQLRDPASNRFTIEGIGTSAGFGSRSALYAAFRRLEGMTPAEFRRRASGVHFAP